MDGRRQPRPLIDAEIGRRLRRHGSAHRSSIDEMSQQKLHTLLEMHIISAP
jgi:hypothetical protein